MREERWYYGTMTPPEGHVIQPLSTPIQKFVEMCRFVLSNAIVIDLRTWVRERDLTLNLLDSVYFRAVMMVRENQDQKAASYNPWDAGATVNVLRKHYVKYRADIIYTFREQKNILRLAQRADSKVE